MREDDPEVVQARQELEKLTSDAQRLSALHEAKSVAFQSVSRVVQAIEDWPKRGRPHGTALQDCDGPEPKPLKGETVTDAVETPAPTRSRAAGRRPSHLQFLLPKFLLQAAHACDGRATGAARRAPDVSSLVEHDRSIAFPTTRNRSVEQPSRATPLTQNTRYSGHLHDLGRRHVGPGSADNIKIVHSESQCGASCRACLPKYASPEPGASV